VAAVSGGGQGGPACRRGDSQSAAVVMV